MNGKLYAVGPSKVDVYNPVTNRWATKAAVPTARFGLATAAVNGVLYAMARSRSGGVVATNVVYTP